MHASEGSVDPWKQCFVVSQAVPMCWHSVAVFSSTQMAENSNFVGKVVSHDG
jgi:hypothetical protein